MNKNGIIIRNETREDYRKVEELTREAFWNVYRPGCMEHYLIHVLRDEEVFIPELDFVMEKDGKVIGHCAFTRSHIDSDGGKKVPTLTLGPISIAPDRQKKGYGKMLLEYAFAQAAKLGGAVLFEGNIAFYSRCGCVEASNFGIRYAGMPEGEEASFFLCRELIPGYLEGAAGQYGPPEAYYVGEEETEEFDKSFPPKEKLRLPGQLF